MVNLIMPCETLINRLLPGIRSYVARNLYEKHNFNQIDIASVLDVSQPTVSKYLSDDYKKKIKFIMKNKKVRKIADEITDSIVEKRMDNFQVTSLILKYCCQLIKENPNMF